MSVIVLLILCLWGLPGFATHPESNNVPDLSELSLDELLNMEVGVTSEGNAKSVRETPGIVTVFTEDDLAKLPARDLLDLIQWVPGFFAAVDVQGVVGLGIRGNWGHEGKILLVIDGIEMNELLYSTNQFGNHYPLANIKKVEIIRGPGSALYGGNAELAVISVTTKTGKDLQGGQVNLNLGQMAGANARRNLQWSWGSESNGWDLSFSGFYGEGRRSDQTYHDLYGNSLNMAQANELNPRQFSFGASRGKLEIRLFWDNYQTTTQDLYDVALTRPAEIDFKAKAGLVKYQWQVGDQVKITPRFRYRQYNSWEQVDTVAHEDGLIFDHDIHRINGDVTLLYTPSPSLEWVAGLGGYQENATAPSHDESGDVIATDKAEFVNTSAFAQVSFEALHLNWTLGGRYEDHNQFGGTFVPRLAATGLFGKWHVKGLYSKAFRSPNVENFFLNNEILPEQTTVIELEAGYQINASSVITLNAFDNEISDPIVYFFDETEQYKNYPKVATRGLEGEYRYQQGHWSATLNFSTYEKVSNQAPAYEVASDDKALLGVPANKLGIRLNRQLGSSWLASLGVLHEGKKWGYVALDENEEGVLGAYDATNQVHIQLTNKKAFGLEGLDLTLGIFNAFNEENWYVQPYASYHGALPGLSREVSLRAQYRY